MPEQRIRLWQLIVLLVGCAFLFFFQLGTRDLWSSHEARAGQNAQSMLDRQRWGLPELNDGKPDLQKPPLYYWIVALLGKMQGGQVNAWAVRLPAALAACLTVWWLLCLGRLRRQPGVGMLAAGMLATMMHFTWLARTGRIDMVLTFTISLGLGCFYLAMQTDKNSRRRMWLIPVYLSVGLSVLLKGPIGLLLPMIIAGVWLLSERELPATRGHSLWSRIVLRSGLWWGLLLIAQLILPWVLWVQNETQGEFLRVFVWHHNVERGLGGSETLAEYPFWYYGPRLVIDLLPWSLLFPPMFWWFLRNRWWREDSLARFGLLWFVSVVFVLSLAKFKRADYLLPAYPGAALFLGACLHRCWQQALRVRLWQTLWLSAVGLVCLGWFGFLTFYLPAVEPHRQQKSFAECIRSQVPLPEPVIFFRVEDHLLAFHVGHPIDTILEWENIDTWASRPITRYIVMTPDCAGQWEKHIHSGRLQVVAHNTDFSDGYHESPLVLLRTCPNE